MHLITEVYSKRPKWWGFRYDEEYLILSDDGVIRLDWAISTKDTLVGVKDSQLQGDFKEAKFSRRPILIVVPGINSNNDQLYLLNLVKGGIKHGYRVVMVNHRGCSETEFKTAKTYCAGWTEDLREAVEHIKE